MSHRTAFLRLPAAALRRALLAAALSALCAAPAGAQPAPAAPVSPAEQLVFNEPHLGNVHPPQTLRYRYLKSGRLEEGFEDEVSLALRARREGGCCSVSSRFLGGERALALPEIDDARANPAILYFLERDVREMQRRTQGASAYFRKRLRLALVERATVRDTVVRVDGAELPAQEVSVRPYEDDPMRRRYERYAGKEYRFVFARGVPGGLYQIRTRVPGAEPADPPLIEETMTLADTPTPSAPAPVSGGPR